MPTMLAHAVIRHLLQSATTTRARAESVKEWLEHVESGGLLRADFPLDMVLSALEPEVSISPDFENASDTNVSRPLSFS